VTAGRHRSDRPRHEPRGSAVRRAVDPFAHARPARLRLPGSSGQGLIEYGLILVVMAVICTISLVFFSDQLSSLLSLIATAV
jgi:hypothetical protein